jgi:hypothetical protein
MSSRAKWEDMAREWAGTHGTASCTKSNPCKDKEWKPTAKDAPVTGEVETTRNIILDKQRRDKEEMDKY